MTMPSKFQNIQSAKASCRTTFCQSFAHHIPVKRKNDSRSKKLWIIKTLKCFSISRIKEQNQPFRGVLRKRCSETMQ